MPHAGGAGASSHARDRVRWTMGPKARRSGVDSRHSPQRRLVLPPAARVRHHRRYLADHLSSPARGRQRCRGVVQGQRSASFSSLDAASQSYRRSEAQSRKPPPATTGRPAAPQRSLATRSVTAPGGAARWWSVAPAPASALQCRPHAAEIGNLGQGLPAALPARGRRRGAGAARRYRRRRHLHQGQPARRHRGAVRPGASRRRGSRGSGLAGLPRSGTPCPRAEADAYLERQIDFDPDIWIVSVEDRQGRHFLEDWLAA